ncbi:MAG TPA: vitamin K epoxide reductase family protein [Polyangium sp.]|nr:vitamin K epoxide reductase family protein [Polyangium sp.]
MRLLPVLLLRLALLVAIAASAALIVDYANAGDPAFCGVTSGCYAVRRSGYAYAFGYIPLPHLGLVSFASLFAIAFSATNRLQHKVVAALASLGAVIALYLIWLQNSVIGALCPWCVTVDSSAIIAAVCAWWVVLQSGKDEASVQVPKEGRVAFAWLAAALIGIIAPFVWGSYPANPAMAPAIKQEQVEGKLTIVSLTDFECPFCRRLHSTMHQVLEEHEGRIHFVRKMVPLPGHPGAEPAALTYLCTPKALQPAVADKLYSAKPAELTTEGTAVLAGSVGVDVGELGVCVRSPETRAKLEADKKVYEELGGPGLPYTYVGKRAILGANADGLKAAVERGLSGDHLSLPVWAMFALLGAAFVTAIGVTLRATTTEKPAT